MMPRGHLTAPFVVYTIMMPRLIWDPDKDAHDLIKHGVSLALAVGFEWESTVFWSDLRRDYGEIRVAAIGYIGLRLYQVVFVDRADERRVISLRKANRREVNRYAKA